mgnify:FL=1
MDYGLHKTENRRGQVLIQLDLNGRELHPFEYPVLGYYLGKALGSRIGVVDGIKGSPSTEELKNMMAGAAASGSVALLHIVASHRKPSQVETAFQGRKPEDTIVVTEDILLKTRQDMSTGKKNEVDFVALGCPHYTIREIEAVTRILKGRKIKPGVQCWIYTTKSTAMLAERMGYRQKLEESGVILTLETCMLISPVETWGFHTIMTDSAKCAYYAPMQCKTQVLYAPVEDCINAIAADQKGGEAL